MHSEVSSKPVDNILMTILCIYGTFVSSSYKSGNFAIALTVIALPVDPSSVHMLHC